MDKRVSMLNQSWGMPEYNHFGTEEFLTFCKHVGAVPQICLNLGSGTPQEAADWVRFVNLKWGRGGLLWELGNELWGDFQIGYPTIRRVAARTREFAEAVRAVDRNAQLIATGADPDHFREWNAEQLALPAGTFQYLSTHFVVGTGSVHRKNPAPEFIAESAFALPVGLERKLREMRTPNAKIAFTEWLFHGPARSPRFDTMGGAVCTAGFLNTLIRTADFVTLSDMTGLIEFGGVWKKKSQVFGVPAYWAFRMYSTADATQPVEAKATVASYNVDEGNHRIPQIHDVPYLDAVAALNDAGDTLTLFVVNRKLDREIAAEIRIDGFTPAGPARASELKAASIYDGNTEENPESIKPVEKIATLPRYAFPPSSVTVLTLVSRPPAR
jgi:alpha-N-arabinofuranosidase